MCSVAASTLPCNIHMRQRRLSLALYHRVCRVSVPRGNACGAKMQHVEVSRTTITDSPIPIPITPDSSSFPASMKEFQVPPESFLPAYKLPDGISIAEAGETLEALLEDGLTATGAVLIRNIPVTSTADVALLVVAAKAAHECKPSSDWTDMPYVPFSTPRPWQDGVMLATVLPPSMTLMCHNESVYNPLVPRRIGLLCLKPSLEGGESLIVSNEDLHACGPEELFQFVRDHGGLLFKRVFHDKATTEDQGPWAMSWQDRCGLCDNGTRADAEEYWKANGFEHKHISWADDGSLVVSNVTTGFTPVRGAAVGANFPGGHSEFSTCEELAQNLNSEGVSEEPQASGAHDQREWCNILCNMPPGSVKTTDGCDVPQELLKMHEQQAWRKTYAFKMQQGDLLLLDNLRVQHGRLPYSDSDGNVRTVATLLYE